MRNGDLGRVLGLVVLLLAFLAAGGCGKRVLRFDLVPVEDELTAQVIDQDEGLFVTDKIVIINLSGLLTNQRAQSWFSQGSNPVSDCARR